MTVTIALTGDICPTRRLDVGTLSASPVFSALARADLAIGNLEMPLTDLGFPIEKLLNIRASPEIAEDVAKLGLDVVTLANNHAVDCGWSGLEDTAARLRAHGLPSIGSGPNLAAASAPFFGNIGGRRVGVVAFSCLTPAGMSASADRPGIAPIHISTSYEIDPIYQAEEPGDIAVVTVRTRPNDRDRQYALQTIVRVKAECDFLVVTLHWGFGSGEGLAEYQRPLAEAMIKAGAGVVHGHHPHAIHAIGFHERKPIIFSSGTLIGQQVFLPASDQVQQMWSEMSPDGFVSELTVERDGETALRLIPTTLDADRLPVTAEGEVLTRIHERLDRLSRPHGATVSMCDGGLHVRPL
ncbi:poly-gamma-glutamate capsule biosynthesis protein CapA/YwtB (metallophosphatase superfamily) [Devosia sp. UYZn731]|uniref:CapA family protein n=1 Tax=Devosia sp. UYZn731 TaxID=3156345 RepID=UPI003395016E